MADVTAIPSFGFARGAVVRRHDGGPNMLVVRGFLDVTVVVVVEGDRDGQLRLREVATSDLVELLPTATPRDGEAGT